MMITHVEARSFKSESNESDQILGVYLKNVEHLLTDIKQWCLNKNLRVEKSTLPINEERHGEYSAPCLRIQDHNNKQIADIAPFGQSIVGSSGRIDVVGEYGKREKVVYLHKGGPTITTTVFTSDNSKSESRTSTIYRGVDAEGWYWVSPAPIRRAFLLTEDIFFDLLSAVSSYEF